MARLTWLAAELRAAGLRVVEVDGWRTRGSDDFHPVGVTWHATAGSRTSTAQGEVGVILNGSNTAPPPIAQLMIYRDGTIYVCAAGRCNHNKIGWGGLNRGLGNTNLLGIECANDNRGEPWPPPQLDALRRATAVIMRKLGADPMRRLAAHYEHQPASGRPAGETSTKTDPAGIRMSDERPRVAAIMRGEIDMTPTEVRDEVTASVKRLLYLGHLAADPVNDPRYGQLDDADDQADGRFVRDTLRRIVGAPVDQAALLRAIATADGVDEQALVTALVPALSAAVLAGLPDGTLTTEDVEGAVRAVLREGVGA